MAVLPAGVRVHDQVAVPRTTAPGDFYHRHVEGVPADCGAELVTLTGVTAYLAVGMGCQPCPGCWPPPAPPIPVTVDGPPLVLRPAVPGLNPAGYRSALGHDDRVPAVSRSRP